MTEITHIGDLTPDPRNARKHNPRNIGMLTDALHAVGAARSIVIDEAGVVLAGNGVIEAAADAGITRLRVIDADGEEIIAVRRSGLTAEQKTKLALYDNRVAELADWNPEELLGLQGEGFDLSGMFYEDELEKVLAASAETGLPAFDGEPEGDRYREQYGVIVVCPNEMEQEAAYLRLTELGYSCKVVVT